jgi:hypothetical protein
LRIAFSILARNDNKFRLNSISIGGKKVFESGKSSSLFEVNSSPPQPLDGARYDVRSGKDFAHLGEMIGTVVDLPASLLRKVVYFPSRREATLGVPGVPSEMASGRGLVSWLKSAASADPSNLQAQRDHAILKDFEQEFTHFAGLRSLALSVPDFTNPVPQDFIPEISATVDGQLLPISKLGLGLAEALIILLFAKVSQELDPSIDVFLLEEPELHFASHPSAKAHRTAFAVGRPINREHP